jgi:CTP synthase (UTP-ammonia lyase)
MAKEARIGIIGDYQPANVSHPATEAALHHAGDRLSVAVEITWLPTKSLEPLPSNHLQAFDALWCAPGSPYQSMNGALNAIRWAREHNQPLLGTCAGFQHIVVEYARTVLGINDARHAEYGETSGPLVITPLSCSLERGKNLEILVDPASRAGHIYNERQIREQFWCTFGLNRAYHASLHAGGLPIVGVDPDGEARIVEVPGHPFFIGTLFIPQLNSTAARPHPLVTALMEEAIRVSQLRRLAHGTARSAYL